MSMVCPLKSTKSLAEFVWVFPLFLVFPLLIFLSLGYHQRECMRKCRPTGCTRAGLRIHSVICLVPSYGFKCSLGGRLVVWLASHPMCICLFFLFYTYKGIPSGSIDVSCLWIYIHTILKTAIISTYRFFVW